MNATPILRSLLLAGVAVLMPACEREEPRPALTSRQPATVKSTAEPVAPERTQPVGNTDGPEAEQESDGFAVPVYRDDAPVPAGGAKIAKLGRNIYLEVDGDRRRVLVNAYVCMRKGQLEQLMCRKDTKEHESILVADIDARQLHLALLAAGATPGKPVQFEPMYVPASGQRIRVLLRPDKAEQAVPAQQWVRNIKSRKDLAHDWVFAGSRLYPHPEDPDKPPYYLANDGDVICVSNFESALLDLPIASPTDDAALAFEPHTERVPPKNTKVLVILEPIPEKKE
jgi:hypothetical protein